MFIFNVKESIYLEHLGAIEDSIKKLGEDFTHFKENQNDDSEFWERHSSILKDIEFLKSLID